LLLQSYQYPNLSEGADRVTGQLHGGKEGRFRDVTKSGRVWRKMPESGAGSEGDTYIGVASPVADTNPAQRKQKQANSCIRPPKRKMRGWESCTYANKLTTAKTKQKISFELSATI